MFFEVKAHAVIVSTSHNFQRKWLESKKKKFAEANFAKKNINLLLILFFHKFILKSNFKGAFFPDKLGNVKFQLIKLFMKQAQENDIL